MADRKVRDKRRQHPFTNLMSACFDKFTTHQLLDYAGAPRPQIHHVVDGIEALKPEHLTHPCVVKPPDSNGSKGVVPLWPLDGGGFYSIRDGDVISLNDLRDRQRRSRNRWGYSDRWIIEELVLPPDGSQSPVPDLKFYCFFGRIGLILYRISVVGKSRVRYRWFTADWTPVDVGKYGSRIDETLTTPSTALAFSEQVVAVSEKIPLPFVRIDTYWAAQGLLFGEFTPRPGGWDEFSEEFDEHLGRYFEDAESRLQAKVLRGEPLIDRKLGSIIAASS